jgi:glycosyltransferase involved in cell wall biosynthesis
VRVALESTVLELDSAGTARAVRGLRAALVRRDDVEVVEVAHPPRGVPRGARGVDRELRWFWLGLPRAVRRARADLLHLPAAIGPWRAPVPFVVTINDAMAVEHPEWFSRANALQQRIALRRLVRAARRVVVPSRYTAARLEAVAGLDPARVRLAPWGVGEPFSPGAPDEAVLRRHRVERPYLLAVGTLQPRKGLDDLLDAVDALDGGHQLVVAGARGWRDEEIAARLQGRAILPGRVEDRELVTLMRGAEALVHAARHEGFGFPPLEAMACGTPVVAYRSTSLPEVVGDGGELADPVDGALGEALARVLADPARQAELRKRGLARAAELTWERCAELTVAAYREALDG